jgi:hypothetical protein
MEKISEEILEHIREQFIGKKVSIEDGDGMTWVGELFFIGYNSVLESWGLYATIGRTPIQHIKLNSLKEYL